VQKLKTSTKNTKDDNVFMKTQVKDSMKHNKLLEVALKKTEKQTGALKEFLKRNHQIKDENDTETHSQFITQKMYQ